MLKKSGACFLALLMLLLVLPISTPTANAAAETNLSGMTVFTFSGNSVTVDEGTDTNYEVVVYDCTDSEISPDTSSDNEGNTVYSVPDGSQGELRISIKKKGGSYVFQGNGTGSIAVNKEATGASVLYLNGLTLSSEITSVITVKKGSTTTCTVCAVDNTVNTLTDSAFNNSDNYGSSDDGGDGSNLAAESAVIKAKTSASLILTGEGTLNLECNSKNAIKVGESGSLNIEKLSLNITSVNHGISSDNTIEINSGEIVITAEGDAIRSDPDSVDEDAGCAGNITILGGGFVINAGSDGIQAAQNLNISGGSFVIKTGSGYNDSSFNSDTMSCKGLKASSSDENESDATNVITITGGIFNLNTADDAIHSDGYVIVTKGVFYIQTGDDGIHADTSLTLGTEDGSDDDIHINVAASYEGLEAGNVYIYSGNYNVISSDDGINAAGGSDSSDANGNEFGNKGFNPGGGPSGPGSNTPGAGNSGATEKDYNIYVSGGNILVNADGDGLDSNGNIYLTGGNIISWGAAYGSADNPLDCDGTLYINGATVFAAGANNNMAVSPSSGSQTSVKSTSTASVGQTISVTNNNTAVYSIQAAKRVNYILYSAPGISSSCKISISGSSSPVTKEECSHIWSSVAYTTQADCLNDGVLVYICTECGETKTETVSGGHIWDSGVSTATCTEDGITTYTCTVCGETKTESVTATGHIYSNGYCVNCGEAKGDIEGYVVTFVPDEHCSVTTYLTQDTSNPYETDALSAVARSSDTGLVDISGDGQVNFSIKIDEGYSLESVEITDGADNYKNLKTVDSEENIYRITKITGNLTVNITVTKDEEIVKTDDLFYGDVNLDGEFSIDDVTLIQKYLAEMETLTDTQYSLADVNGDGVVSIDDATLIQKFIADYDDCGRTGEAYNANV